VYSIRGTSVHGVIRASLMCKNSILNVAIYNIGYIRKRLCQLFPNNENVLLKKIKHLVPPLDIREYQL
jgi:hypothetical protein